MIAAHCNCCTEPRKLTFERHEYFPKEWNCWCPESVDGDYDYETGRMHATYTIGSGDSPEAALEDYAEKRDVDAKDLLVKEGM